MESRFLRFGRSRRDKSTSPKLEPEFQSLAYSSTALPENEPIFIHQPLGKNSQELKRFDDSGLLLKSFAYDSLSPGKTPQFGGAVTKGNGPVRLQTSRRLSSGELINTSQNNQRTLEDIREGDYIVSHKTKRDATSQSPRLGSSHNPGTTSRLSYSLRSRPSTSRSTRTNRDSNWSAPLTPTSPIRHSGVSVPSTPPTGLGIISSTPAQESSYDTSDATSPELTEKSPLSSKANEEPNATIAALWRAEYGRLVKLYGQDGVDRDVLGMGKPALARGSSHSSMLRRTKPSPITTDLPPPPGSEGIAPKRASDGSSKSSTSRDDYSEVSSQTRESISSSWAASSVQTTQTSAPDVESPTTREDIRKMIEDIRSNYLHAIESQSPPILKKKSTKKRRKPRLGASPLIIGIDMSTDRQTWHGEDAAWDSSNDQVRRRTASHPVHTFGRLSPIQASPSRPDMRFELSPNMKSKPDLKRADSMTLGSLMLQLPSSAGGAHEQPPKATIDTTERPKTVATSGDRSWLHLELPTTSFMSGLSQKEGSVLNLEEYMKPRYVPDDQAVTGGNKPPTPPLGLRSQPLHSIPQRPAPPSLSIAELVNFI